MIFTQPIFFAFLALTLTGYWALARWREAQLALVLVASAIFYGWWDWRFLGLIGLVILVSWGTAKFICNKPAGRTDRRLILTLGISLNLLVLGAFKYFNFFLDSSVVLLQSLGIKPDTSIVHIILPVGISFYVFQAISYIVDVARDDVDGARPLHRVALYIAFFPQLVAGPIVRAASFFPQMERQKRLTRPLVASGLRAFLLGFAYKAGIADNLAIYVDPVFGDALTPDDADLSVWSNSALIGASLAFAAQIYFDFAGYSLMAIGVARWFGFFIPKNFDYPYSSNTLQDFWRRWHISLSSWLRDYLYIPLGGNRKGSARTYLNLFITMMLGGLWHGAAWTFVAWGALHGAGLAVNRAVSKSGKAWPYLAGLALTQTFVLLAWVPFRAEDFADTLTGWSAFTGLREGGPQLLSWTVWLVPLLIIMDAALGRTDWNNLSRHSLVRHPAIYWIGLGAVTGLLLALYPLEAKPFVYFQF